MTDVNLRDFYARYIEALNAHEFDRMDEFAHENVSQQGEPASRAILIANLRSLTDAVPDFHWETQELIVDGDRLGARLINSGTPTKEWLGVAPRNKRFEIVEFAVYTISNGRFRHMSAIHDGAVLKKQLEGEDRP